MWRTLKCHRSPVEFVGDQRQQDLTPRGGAKQDFIDDAVARIGVDPYCIDSTLGEVCFVDIVVSSIMG